MAPVRPPHSRDPEDVTVMAVPKRRLSRANTHSRRSQWKADNPALQETKIDGRAVVLPRRLVKAAKLGLVDLDR